MATSGGNTYFARPVYLGAEKQTFGNVKANGIGPRGNKIKHTRFAAEVENTDPPPRPPPPRPSRAPKQTENASNGREIRRILPKTPQDTHETKPLTRLNVTSHDRLWQRESSENENTGPTDVLSPPLKYITPETTQEMMRNFDPLDIIDSHSEHSDSSADTMIMMTTEEERNNKEKIDRSLKQFTSVKTKPERQDTNRTKGNMQTKQNLHIRFSDTNGIDQHKWRRVPNGQVDNDDQTYSKVVPLHIRTDTVNNGSSPESATVKSNGNHGSPNDSPDDGYGTNSSSGTVSSPFSSSFGSNDFENSYNGNSKRVSLPNGAIKPNSVRESWAVKRKQRMIEAQDNSVQEQLRQLTVIEEEGSRNMSKGSRKILDKNLNRPNSGQTKPSEKPVLKNGIPSASQSRSRVDSEDDQAFVNVSQNDLRRINQQLYVISSEREAIQGTRRRSERTLPQTPSTNEINAPRVPPPHSNVDNVTYSLPRRRTRNSDDIFTSQPVNQVNGFPENHRNNNWEDESDVSGQDSVNSGPMLLRGGAEQKYRTASGSGKIYVSPTGDEGFYSLNRSSRSTSMSSFQPINEVSENSTGADNGEPQRSPIEVALSGELFEKWSDMDRNYRNYYGFDGNAEKYSRTDSKVNYFQEKKINTMYGHDNYYRPANYGSQRTMSEGQGRGLQATDHVTQGQSLSQGSANQGTHGDSKDKNSTLGGTSKSSSKSQSKSGKEKDPGSSKSKFFQILPNMFKPSNKKNTGESKDGKHSKGKQKKLPVPVTIEPVPVAEPSVVLEEYEQEAEYINMGDLPQYSVANVEYEEKLRKGQFASLENLNKRPVFASSRDIKKLFSQHDQSFDSIHSPGTQRHSFHAMPLSYRHKVNMNPTGDEDDMRPRASSTSATLRSQQLVESRMALIARKNAAVMNEARQAQLEENKPGNLSFHSNNSSNQKTDGSRTRLNSGDSSGGDSKLSTLV